MLGFASKVWHQRPPEMIIFSRKIIHFGEWYFWAIAIWCQVVFPKACSPYQPIPAIPSLSLRQEKEGPPRWDWWRYMMSGRTWHKQQRIGTPNKTPMSQPNPTFIQTQTSIESVWQNSPKITLTKNIKDNNNRLNINLKHTKQQWTLGCPSIPLLPFFLWDTKPSTGRVWKGAEAEARNKRSGNSGRWHSLAWIQQGVLPMKDVQCPEARVV